VGAARAVVQVSARLSQRRADVQPRPLTPIVGATSSARRPRTTPFDVAAIVAAAIVAAQGRRAAARVQGKTTARVALSSPRGRRRLATTKREEQSCGIDGSGPRTRPQVRFARGCTAVVPRRRLSPIGSCTRRVWKRQGEQGTRRVQVPAIVADVSPSRSAYALLGPSRITLVLTRTLVGPTSYGAE
jgi:hypothetical protein